MEGEEIKKENGKLKRMKNLKKWKPGQSGNPKGLPAGTVSITTAIRHKLLEIFPPGKNDKNKEKKLYLDKLVEGILENAIKHGDTRSQKDIWAYMDGHPKATIDIGADKDSLSELTEFFRAVAKHKK